MNMKYITTEDMHMEHYSLLPVFKGESKVESAHERIKSDTNDFQEGCPANVDLKKLQDVRDTKGDDISIYRFTPEDCEKSEIYDFSSYGITNCDIYIVIYEHSLLFLIHLEQDSIQISAKSLKNIVTFRKELHLQLLKEENILTKILTKLNDCPPSKEKIKTALDYEDKLTYAFTFHILNQTKKSYTPAQTNAQKRFLHLLAGHDNIVAESEFNLQQMLNDNNHMPDYLKEIPDVGSFHNSNIFVSWQTIAAGIWNYTSTLSNTEDISTALLKLEIHIQTIWNHAHEFNIHIRELLKDNKTIKKLDYGNYSVAIYSVYKTKQIFSSKISGRDKKIFYMICETSKFENELEVMEISLTSLINTRRQIEAKSQQNIQIYSLMFLMGTTASLLILQILDIRVKNYIFSVFLLFLIYFLIFITFSIYNFRSQIYSFLRRLHSKLKR